MTATRWPMRYGWREEAGAGPGSGRGLGKGCRGHWPSAHLIAPKPGGDPNGIALEFLGRLGNAVGRSTKVRGGRRQPQPLNLSIVIGGLTGRGRKGTAAWEAVRPFEVADPAWVNECIF